MRKAYALLTTARMGQEEWHSAVQSNERGRRFYPDDIELLYQAGQVYQQVGRFAEARLALEALVAQGSGAEARRELHYRSVDTSLSTYKGRFELALLHRRMGDGPHCSQILQDIVRSQPKFEQARIELKATLRMLQQV